MSKTLTDKEVASMVETLCMVCTNMIKDLYTKTYDPNIPLRVGQLLALIRILDKDNEHAQELMSLVMETFYHG